MKIKDFDLDTLVSISDDNNVLLNLIFYIKNFELAVNENNSNNEFKRLLNVNTNNEIYDLLRQQLEIVSKVFFYLLYKYLHLRNKFFYFIFNFNFIYNSFNEI